MSSPKKSVDIGRGEDVLSKDCPHVAVVNAGRRPPAGLGLDDGAARTAAAPQWNRTPAQGVLVVRFLVAARTCLRRKNQFLSGIFTRRLEITVDWPDFVDVSAL